VLGIDFAPASLAAARWVTTHLAPDAHATLVHVVPFPSTADARPMERTAAERAVQQLIPALHGGLAGLAAMLKAASVRALVRIGKPSRWLTELAGRNRHQLIGLGRRRNSARERVGEPNIIERVARLTSNPLLVVPEGFAQRPRHVIAALDVGGSALQVLRSALAVAERLSARLTVAHVLSPAHGAYDRVVRGRHTGNGVRTSHAVSAREAGSRATIYHWLTSLLVDARASAFGGRAILNGDAGREITALAGRLGSPLIVVGRRGADGAPMGSIGSVARDLLTRSAWPVLAIETGMVVDRGGEPSRRALAALEATDVYTRGIDAGVR
jgi:nucleotide-binding universal stress UspA family protein